MSLLMSILFTFLWGAACVVMSFVLGSEYLPGLHAYRVPFTGLLFLLGMGRSVLRNRRMANQGGVESWEDAAREDYRFRRTRERQTGEEQANGFFLHVLFLLPQLAVDCFFEFLYSLADEDPTEEAPPGDLD